MFVTNSGKRYEIIGERGKFYLCDGAQFRKASKLGYVEEIDLVVAEPEAVTEPEPHIAAAEESQDETGELTDE